MIKQRGSTEAACHCRVICMPPLKTPRNELSAFSLSNANRWPFWFLCQLALTITRIFGEWKIVKLLGLNLPFGHLNDTNFEAKYLAEKRKKEWRRLSLFNFVVSFAGEISIREFVKSCRN